MKTNPQISTRLDYLGERTKEPHTEAKTQQKTNLRGRRANKNSNLLWRHTKERKSLAVSPRLTHLITTASERKRRRRRRR
jgi:hypothetical protein